MYERRVYRNYVARVRPKGNSSPVGVVVNATDESNARYKIDKQYPGCVIIELRVR
jgi:hypothetical protein